MTALAPDLRDGHDAVSAATTQRRLAAVAAAAREPVPGTLDAVLADTLSAVGAGRAGVCPVCSGTMRPRWTANSGTTGGRCVDCDSTLA